ncbi:MAG: mechanosensitive ion channel family protein [Gammaproteobacteria bacterium]
MKFYFWLSLTLGLLASPLALAEEASNPDLDAQVSVSTSSVPSNLANPAATWRSFNQAAEGLRQDKDGAMDDALETLDLSEINPIVQRERGGELAWSLAEVVARVAKPRSAPPSDADSDEVVLYRFAQGDIKLSRVADGRWLISKDSLRALPLILDNLPDDKSKADSGLSASQPLSLRIKRAMPKSLRGTTILLEHWQWLGIALVVMIGVMLDKIIAVVLASTVRRWRSEDRSSTYGDIEDGLLRPFALMAMAATWWMGINLLSLPDGVFAVLLLAAKVLAALSGVWGAYRLVDLLGAYLKAKAAGTASNLDDILVPMFVKTAKILVAIVGVIFIADTLQMNVAGLIAGLGLGGLAFALAAKDVVENLFGSITVLLDRPFGVGDWVVIGDVEGTVEAMGFRSTRIRTFYNSLITMPNSAMITAHVDNMGARRYRRYSTKLGLTYDTPPEKIEAFCEGVRELVRLHPSMRKDYYHVYFNDYGATSLDIMVYVFFKVPDWSAELKARHEFLLAVLRLADTLGVEFAFPTQTLFMRKEEGWEEATPLSNPALEAGKNAAKAAMEHRLPG